MTTLKQLSEKIQSRFNRLTGLTPPINQVKTAIKSISTDYDNFTPEMTQEVMDILKDKNDSQIQNANGIPNEVDTVKLEDQTLDNLTEETPMESNQDNKMVKSESQAITFSDDFEKSIAVRNELATQNIQLSRSEVFEVADNIGNKFESREHMMFAIVTAIQNKENGVAEKYKNGIANILANIHETKAIAWKRSILMVQDGMDKINTLDDQGFEAVADILCAGFNLDKEKILKGIL